MSARDESLAQFAKEEISTSVDPKDRRRLVPGWPCMVFHAKCYNSSCPYFFEKIDEELEGSDYPEDHPARYVICETPSAKKVFTEYSRAGPGADQRIFRGDLKVILDPRSKCAQTAVCPGCKEALKPGNRSGPDLVTIGFRGCQFSLTYRYHLDFEDTAGVLETVHIPEPDPICSGEGNLPLIDVGSDELCTLIAKPFRHFDKLKEITVEMREWPMGFALEGVCPNDSCPLRKVADQIQDRPKLAQGCCSFGLGKFTVELERDGFLVRKNKSVAPVQCKACATLLKPVERIDLTRCVCQIKTAQRTHAKIYCCGRDKDGIRLNLRGLREKQPEVFPLEFMCDPLHPGIVPCGECSRGSECPLQDPQLKKLCMDDTATFGKISTAYTAPIVPLPATHGEITGNNWTRINFHRDCKACKDSKQFADNSTIDVEALSIYKCGYKLEYSPFEASGSGRKVREPPERNTFYIAEGHVQRNLSVMDCKIKTLMVVAKNFKDI